MKKPLCAILCMAMLFFLCMPMTVVAERVHGGTLILSLEEGKKALASELEMSLSYGKVTGENKAVTVYEPEIDIGSHFAVSAESGKRVELAVQEGGGGPAWPPEITRSIDEAEAESEKLLGEKELSKIISEMTETPVFEYSVDFISYVYSGRDEHGYSYKAHIKLSKNENSAEVIFDAKTGKLEQLSVKSQTEVKEAVSAELNKEELISSAENFIEKYLGINTASLALTDDGYNYFNFSRYVNGIKYKRDRVFIAFDEVTGKVTAVTKFWNDGIVFDDLKGIISLEEAKERFINANSPEFRYAEIRSGDTIETVPVYVLSSIDTYLSCIDAKKGKELMWGAGELVEKQSEFQVNHKKLFKTMALFCAQKYSLFWVSMLPLCVSESMR